MSANDLLTHVKPAKVAILLPIRKPASAFRSSLLDLRDTLNAAAVPYELILVFDDALGDVCPLARDLEGDVSGVLVLHEERACGRQALLSQLLARSGADAVILLPADGVVAPRDIICCWELLNDGWDAAFGVLRAPSERPDRRRDTARALTETAAGLAQSLLGVPAELVAAPVKGASARFLDPDGVTVHRVVHGSWELSIRVVRRGLRWTTFPVTDGTHTLRLFIRDFSRIVLLLPFYWFERMLNTKHELLREDWLGHSRSGRGQVGQAPPLAEEPDSRSTKSARLPVLLIAILAVAAIVNWQTAFGRLRAEGGSGLTLLHVGNFLGWAAAVVLGLLYVGLGVKPGRAGAALAIAAFSIFVQAAATRKILAAWPGGFTAFVKSEVTPSYNLGYGRLLARNMLGGYGFVFRPGLGFDHFRTPGYPAFVAVVSGVASISLDDVESVTKAVILGQTIFFGAAVGIFVILYSKLVGLWLAALLGFGVSLIPYGVVYTQADTIVPALALLITGGIAWRISTDRAGRRGLGYADVYLHVVFVTAVFVRSDLLLPWVAVTALLYFRHPRLLWLPVTVFILVAAPWAIYKNAHGQGLNPLPASTGHVAFVGLWDAPANDFGYPGDSDTAAAWFLGDNGLVYGTPEAFQFLLRHTIVFYLTYPGYVITAAIYKLGLFFSSWGVGTFQWPLPAQMWTGLLHRGLNWGLAIVVVVGLLVGPRRRELAALAWPLLFHLPLFLLLYSSSGRFTTDVIAGIPIAAAPIVRARLYWRRLAEHWLWTLAIALIGMALWVYRAQIGNGLLRSDFFRYASPLVSPERTFIRRRIDRWLQLGAVLPAGLRHGASLEHIDDATVVSAKPIGPSDELLRVSLNRIKGGATVRVSVGPVVGGGRLCIANSLNGIRKCADLAESVGSVANTIQLEVEQDGSYELVALGKEHYGGARVSIGFRGIAIRERPGPPSS